jgi:ABC-type lipoprotein export system ATPase subunit
MTPVLQFRGVSRTYRRSDEQLHALVDFDFTLDAGEFVVVTGPSGAGKSTLLHADAPFPNPYERIDSMFEDLVRAVAARSDSPSDS